MTLANDTRSIKVTFFERRVFLPDGWVLLLVFELAVSFHKSSRPFVRSILCLVTQIITNRAFSHDNTRTGFIDSSCCQHPTHLTLHYHWGDSDPAV